MLKTNKLMACTGSIAILIILIILSACHQQSPSHYLKNGSAKYQLQDYSGAIRDLDRAIRLKDDYKEAYYLRALSYVHLNRFDQAAEDFDKVIEIDPFFRDAWFNRAFYIKQSSGDYRGAIGDYNRFIELSPEGDHSFALNNRGYCRFRLDDFEGALEDISNSVSLNMSNSYAYRNRALVYIAMENPELACDDLETALALGFTKSYGGEVQELLEQYCDKEPGAESREHPSSDLDKKG
jgi:tetratricopeptide (TPR) repeat protein